ncbi:MAG: hypothetical protein K8F54_10895 [Altibacter sp.]|uniref:hypothetical protein n=1 Tax=Altibacter sp. TaxID=2024823 RepID=UPI001D9708EF|nr:hypothetical protein [Altibacter sp.]MBZ0328103.1 hypothetical protein [Altibacter sp.]
MKVENLLFITTLLELVAAILATVHFKKYENSTERYFLYFLWYTFFVEIGGAVIAYVFEVKNFWLYNAFTITSFLFYFYWYSTILEKKIFKRAVLIFTLLFLCVSSISLFYQSWLEYHTYTLIAGAVFVLILTLFHFYQLLNSNEVLIVKYKLSFWISTALLLFYMGIIPLFTLLEYINIQGLSYILILVGLNMILYGCYIIGFIWTKKKYNRF